MIRVRWFIDARGHKEMPHVAVSHAAAYWLLDTLRRWLRQMGVARLDTLRLRLIKIGGWVRAQVGGFRPHLASSHPGEQLWHLLAAHSPSP